jgi:hypothetical protein
MRGHGQHGTERRPQDHPPGDYHIRGGTSVSEMTTSTATIAATTHADSHVCQPGSCYLPWIPRAARRSPQTSVAEPPVCAVRTSDPNKVTRCWYTLLVSTRGWSACQLITVVNRHLLNRLRAQIPAAGP